MVQHLVYTTLSSSKPGSDTGYMVQPPEGMLEVDKGSQHQPAQDRFLIVQARRARLALLMLRGSVFPCRRYVEGCMKVICGREYLDWTMELTRWTMQHWRQVLFIDESRFCHR
jgi:hypothetical protein